MGVYNRIHAYGIELEGAWDDEPMGAVHDGSLEGMSDCDYVGELPSPILYSLDQVAIWVRENFYVKCNETCGMHVHMSFKNLADYALLMDDVAVQEYILDGLGEWASGNSHISSQHPIYSRLAGDNEMCELNFIPEIQAESDCKGHERYNVLNFCYTLHSTLEIRVLPAFDDPYDAIDAIQCLSGLINSWLKMKRPRKLKKTVIKLIMSKTYRNKQTTVLSNLKSSHPLGYSRGEGVTVVNGKINIKSEMEVG